MRRLLHAGLRRFGLQIKTYTPPLPNGLDAYYRDIETDFIDIHHAVKPFTMTSIDRQYNLYKALQHIIDQKIEGDFVECGVYKGGSSMVAGLVLRGETPLKRHLWLYDTFAGMTAPTEHDAKTGNTNEHTQNVFNISQASDYNEWCYAGLDEVKHNIASTNFPADKIHFIKGNILETVPQNMPDKIAILRLDTDFYDSTKHELEHLYPRLVSGGILIIDDYGSWQGARKAVDEYFATQSNKPLLMRIDDTGRMGIKP